MNEFFKKPVVKILMLKGEKGDKGNTGTGTPKGGKTGQYLLKKSNADYDYVWSPITTVSWDNVSGKPDAYPTTWEKVTGKQDATTTTAGLMSAKDKSKLNNLQVGGRNLYLDTKSFNNSSVWKNYSSWSKTGETYNGLTVVRNNGAWNGTGQIITMNEGEKYTLSAYINSTESLMFVANHPSYADVEVGTESNYVQPTNGFEKVAVPFVVTKSGTACPRFEEAKGNAGVAKICGLKLERGTIATDWTPAPEDVDSVTKSFTLSASSWSSGSYTISDSLITASSNQEVLPATNITADQYDALASAKIVDAGQKAGSMTIKCLGTKPTIDIPIRVIFRGEK